MNKSTLKSKVSDYQTIYDCLAIIDKKTHSKIKGTMFWIGGKIICLYHENIHRYNEHCEKIYNRDKKVSSTYSLKTFEKLLREFIIDLLIKSIPINERDIATFEHGLFDYNIFMDSILIPISGLSLQSKKAIELGPFKIFEHPTERNLDETAYPLDNHGIYVLIHGLAYRDGVLALEQANLKIHDLIHILFYMIGSKDNDLSIDIGTCDKGDKHSPFRFGKLKKIYYVKNNKVISSSMENEVKTILDLSDLYFTAYNNANSQIWDLYTLYHNKNSSEIQSKVIRSILQVGKSIKSLDIKDSFLNLIISYEILLSYDERSLFSKSIGHNLAETFALILGKDIKERKTIFKDIKSIYGLRSALVHSANKQPTIFQYNKALEYIRRLIFTILTQQKYQKAKTSTEFNNIIDDIRFSYHSGHESLDTPTQGNFSLP
jgi:hypothetical protein